MHKCTNMFVFMQVNAKNTCQVASQLLPFAVPGSSGRCVREVAPRGISL